MIDRKSCLAMIALAALIATSPNRSRAQTVRYVPLGFCSLSSMSSATALTSCAGGIPATATYAVICAYTQGVNYRDDGVAPTGTTGTGGQAITSGSCIGYSGTLSAVQFIQQASGAIVGISFYRIAG